MNTRDRIAQVMMMRGRADNPIGMFPPAPPELPVASPADAGFTHGSNRPGVPYGADLLDGGTNPTLDMLSPPMRRRP